MMKTVLYIGGFEMPDKNAAAQRVLSIGKALRECGYEVKFYGLTKDYDYDGIIDDFEYKAISYPNSIWTWISYAIGKNIISYIEKENPDIIITYNYPAIAQNKVVKFCHHKGIKVVGDITEWYKAHSLVKRVDTFLRMHFSNKRLDGIITISSYLSNYYKKQYYIQIPPLVDKNEDKWRNAVKRPNDNKIRLVYMGTGSMKDRLDKIVKGICTLDNNPFEFEIIGIDEEKFQDIYGKDIHIPNGVFFCGRLPHNEAIKHLQASDFQIFFRDNIRVNNAGFPTKFVESISAGIPVITNCISNISDYVVNGENSFMIEKANEEQIHLILKQISSFSRNQINGIKSNLVVDQFDFHKYTKMISEFLKGL